MNNILNKNIFEKDIKDISQISIDMSSVNSSVEEAVLYSQKSKDNKKRFVLSLDKGNLNSNLKNSNYTRILDIFDSLRKAVYKKTLGTSVHILNFVSNTSRPDENNYFDNISNLENLKRDIALFRTISNVDIYAPCDKSETEFILNNLKSTSNKNIYSYFRINEKFERSIYQDDFFKNKVYTGVPDILYISKNMSSYFEITLVPFGSAIHNVLLSARELERENFKVTVLNMSTLVSHDNEINKNIENFWTNYLKGHKNILTVEEHSKDLGLNSILNNYLYKINSNLKIRGLGIEDDLSSKNIIETAKSFLSL